MTIIEALVKLRNDMKKWISTNLRKKLSINLGPKNKNKILVVNTAGDIEPQDIIDDKIEIALNSLNPKKIGITYSTKDLTDGVSTLESGKFYFVIV